MSAATLTRAPGPGVPCRTVLRIKDDRNRDLIFGRPPTRIVSLVPSETETLFDLGLGDRLVGRTRYCEEPAGAVEAIPMFGGTKDPEVEAIIELAPDLVLANQEENTRPALEALAQARVPVFVSFPRRVTEGIALIARIARICGIDREPVALDWVRRGYHALAERPPESGPGVFLPIWMDPLMTLSGDTYASDMLLQCGARNVFADRQRRYPLAADLGRAEAMSADVVGERDTRYPRITVDEVAARAPDIVLLPDEPHPFGEAERAVFLDHDTPAARRGAVALCSGKDLFWYGTRAIDAIARVRAIIDRLAPES